jgi:hypothetical protein
LKWLSKLYGYSFIASWYVLMACSISLTI